METNKKKIKSKIFGSARKIAAALLVAGMNFGGLPAVVGTSAFFSDAKISFANEFCAGSLNLTVTPESAIFAALGGRDSATNLSGVTVANNGTLPLYYNLSVATSTAEVCDQLEMSVDGLSDFMELGGFYFEQPNKLLPGYSDNTMSLAVRMIKPDNFDSFAGQTCDFVLTAAGRQENLQFGEGFQSYGNISLSVSLAEPLSLVSQKMKIEPLRLSGGGLTQMSSEGNSNENTEEVEGENEIREETENQEEIEDKNQGSGESAQNDTQQESMRIEKNVEIDGSEPSTESGGDGGQDSGGDDGGVDMGQAVAGGGEGGAVGDGGSAGDDAGSEDSGAGGAGAGGQGSGDAGGGTGDGAGAGDGAAGE